MPKRTAKSAAPAVSRRGAGFEQLARRPIPLAKPSGMKFKAARATPKSQGSPASRSEFLAMMSDPWTGPVVGYPDAGATKSVTVRSRHVYTHSTALPTGGYACFLVDGSVINSVASYVSTAGTVSAVAGDKTAVAHPDLTAYQTEFGSHRTLVLGIRVLYNGAEDVGAGRVSVLTGIMADPAGVAIEDLNADAVYMDRVDKGLALVVNPASDPAYEITTSATTHNARFPKTIICLTGAPLTAGAFTIEVTRVVEFEPRHGSLHRAGATATCSSDMERCCGHNMFALINEPVATGETAAQAITARLKAGAAKAMKLYGQQVLQAIAASGGGLGAMAAGVARLTL